MKIEKRDSAGKRTLTVVCDKEAEITYMSEMLLNNRIPYLIAPVRGLLNGREMLLYDLSGYVSLEDHLKEKTADSAFFRKLMLSVAGAFEALDEYLINRESLVMLPGTVFLSQDFRSFFFICFPYENSQTDRQLADLSEYLLSRLDNSERDAVTLGHRFFRLCMKKEISAGLLREATRIQREEKEEEVPELQPEEETVIPKKNRASGLIKKALYDLVGAGERV